MFLIFHKDHRHFVQALFSDLEGKLATVFLQGSLNESQGNSITQARELNFAETVNTRNNEAELSIHFGNP